MMIWLIVVAWVICGVLAYGILKNGIRQSYSKLEVEYMRYTIKDEIFIRFISLVEGPIGLITVITVLRINGYKLGLCFRMPKELCKSRRP